MSELLINDENGKSRFSIGDGEIIIGRSEECGLILKAQAVSRKHSKLFRDGPFYCITDLNSTNGTFVNGVKINEKTALAHRDSIAIGQARIEFYDAEGAMLEDTAIRLAGDFHNDSGDRTDIKAFVDKLIAGIKTVGEKISALNQRIPDTTQGTRALKNTLDIISADIGSIIEENKGVYTAIASAEGKKSEAALPGGSSLPAAPAAGAGERPAENPAKAIGKDYSRVLEEINDIILKVEDYKKASKFILSVAMKIIGTNRGFIVVKDPTIGSITPLVSEISSGEFAESSPSMLVAKYAINTGETIIVDDPMLDSRFMGMSESIVSGIIKSVICLPLIKNGVSLGAIYMDNTQHKRHFTSSDSDFVRALGEKVSALLEKSGFFGELIDEYEQLSARDERIAAYIDQFEKIRTKLVIEGIINETDAEK
ncbi:MAG TPA: FHA domain-containing protein, partial [Candidatus Wallbacteria bacterium]|nr:FHA domain-containing protein [Candidatus Wallbacteria bacterium]